MKVYKILHKPTGLFFRPTKSRGSNLSKDGKIYSKRPNINSYIGNGTDTTVIHIKMWSSTGRISKDNQILNEYFNLNIRPEGYISVDVIKEVPITDWEIVEYEIK